MNRAYKQVPRHRFVKAFKPSLSNKRIFAYTASPDAGSYHLALSRSDEIEVLDEFAFRNKTRIDGYLNPSIQPVIQVTDGYEKQRSLFSLARDVHKADVLLIVGYPFLPPSSRLNPGEAIEPLIEAEKKGLHVIPVLGHYYSAMEGNNLLAKSLIGYGSLRDSLGWGRLPPEWVSEFVSYHHLSSELPLWGYEPARIAAGRRHALDYREYSGLALWEWAREFLVSYALSGTNAGCFQNYLSRHNLPLPDARNGKPLISCVLTPSSICKYAGCDLLIDSPSASTSRTSWLCRGRQYPPIISLDEAKGILRSIGIPYRGYLLPSDPLMQGVNHHPLPDNLLTASDPYVGLRFA
jgi:hypothetical protein